MISIWLAVSGVISILACVVFFGCIMEMNGIRRGEARTLLGIAGAALISPLWPVVIPCLILFGLRKLFKIAEFESPLAARRARRLEEKREAHRHALARINELESELARRDVA